MLDLGKSTGLRGGQRRARGRVGGPRRAEVAEPAECARSVPGSLGRREREHPGPLRFADVPGDQSLSSAKFGEGLFPVACAGVGDREQRRQPGTSGVGCADVELLRSALEQRQPLVAVASLHSEVTKAGRHVRGQQRVMRTLGVPDRLGVAAPCRGVVASVRGQPGRQPGDLGKCPEAV